MRLSEIRNILQENIDPLLKFTVTGDGSLRTMVGIRDTIEAVENISRVPSLEQLSNKILEIREVSSIRSNDAVRVTNNTANFFQSKISQLQNECKLIIALADSIIPSVDENLLCIRISDNVNDLFDFKKLVDTLEKGFQFTYGIKSYPGKIRFAGVEAGTNWLNLLIEGTKYASLIYMIIKVAYEVVRDFYQLENLRKKYNGLDLLNQINSDNAEVLRKLNEQLITKLKDNETLDITSEEFSKLCQASLAFSQIIMEGNKILLSIDAPKEKQEGLLEVVKQIEEHTGEMRQLEAPPEE